MGQTVVFAVLGGILSAMLFLSAAFGSSGALIATNLAVLPLFVVGLSLGATACGLAGIVGLLVVSLILGPAEIVAFTAGCVVPVGMLIYQAVTVRPDDAGIPQWSLPGNLVLWLVAYAAAGILAAAIATGSTGDGLLLTVTAFLTANTSLIANLTGGDGAAIVEPMARFLPAAVAGGWVLMMVLNAAFAQWLVHRFDLAVRPPIGVADIALPGWPVAVLAVLVAAALLIEGQIGYVAENLTIVLAIAFFLAGLGVVHAVLRGRNSRSLLLIVIYAAIIWQSWIALLVVGLGVIEQWVGIRRRSAATGPYLEGK